MNENQAMGLVLIYLFPEQAKINKNTLDTLERLGLVAHRGLGMAIPTVRGEEIALVQLRHSLFTRGFRLKDTKKLKEADPPAQVNLSIGTGEALLAE